MVKRLNDRGETPGVRGGSNMLVYVDVEQFFLDGGKAWWSENNVLLTEGFPGTGGYGPGLPPKYILRIVDATTGDEVVPLPTPEIRGGGIRGGTKVAQT